MRRTSDGVTFIFKPANHILGIKTTLQGRITAVKYVADFTGSGDIVVDPIPQYTGTNDLYEWGYYADSGTFSVTLSNR